MPVSALFRKLLATVAIAALAVPALAAEAIPAGGRGENVEVVGFTNANGKSPFKMTLMQHGDRWLMYTSTFFEAGWSIIDVTDPKNPHVVKWIPGPDNSATWQVDLADGKLIANVDTRPKNWGGDPNKPGGDGVYIYDVKTDPLNPKELGVFKTGEGTHRNGYPGGKYMYLAAGVPGIRGDFFMTVDISDPANPKEVGRFVTETQAAGSKLPDDGARLHGPAEIRGDRAYLSYGGAGLIIGDVSDPANFKEISRLDFAPPFGPESLAVHTVVPYLEKNLLLVNGEPTPEKCTNPLGMAGLVDIKDEKKPRLISLLPAPQPPKGEPRDWFCTRGGRFGPHNQPQLHHNPLMAKQGDLIYLTYFNAGLRIYDISAPYNPVEVGWYLPPDPRERHGVLPTTALVTQSEDVIVDTRGYIYVSHKNDGIYILRYTGPKPGQ